MCVGYMLCMWATCCVCGQHVVYVGNMLCMYVHVVYVGCMLCMYVHVVYVGCMFELVAT